MSAPQRITMRSIGEELLQLANLEKGLGYTVKMLAIAPGRAIRNYLFEDRRRMTRPFAFLVLTITAATFLTLRFIPTGEALWKDFQGDVDVQRLPGQLSTILHWFTVATNQYMNLLYLSSLPGLALGTYVFFYKKGFNLAEHLVINSYIFSFQNLLYCLFVPFFLSAPWTGFLLALLLTAYTLFAYLSTFEERFWPGTLKSIGSYLLSQGVTTFLFLLAGLFLYAWLSL
ncbi:MAG: DUF3667 domain-containing protein [Lewinellaceae bacterium]|nr:DUF3667 domain-containing protein [Lewinellaceae bacterium]